jgi:Alpha/beta-hydrolase family
VDQERAQSNAAELITAIRVELDSLPPDERPELYVYGERLGAYSTGSAFTSVEDMSTTTDGAPARAAATEADIRDPELIWETENRIIYLTHPSDPLVAWTADRATWLDPRGADVHPQVRALPLVGGLEGDLRPVRGQLDPAGARARLRRDRRPGLGGDLPAAGPARRRGRRDQGRRRRRGRPVVAGSPVKDLSWPGVPQVRPGPIG